MNSPYDPPASSQAPVGSDLTTPPKGLWILAYIVGIITLLLAGMLLILTNQLQTMASKPGVSFSLLTNLFIRRRKILIVILGACGLVGILGSFLKSKLTMLALILVAATAAITLAILLAVVYLDLQKAI
jgi:hypothetical protein